MQNNGEVCFTLKWLVLPQRAYLRTHVPYFYLYMLEQVDFSVLMFARLQMALNKISGYSGIVQRFKASKSCSKGLMSTGLNC